MVFCYKFITESPQRSLCTSPRKLSPTRRSINDTNPGDDILDFIPERDWRLLTALARKRDELDERERLAEEFQKMWMKEKEERELVNEEISTQYKRYINEKRCQDRSYQEYRRNERNAEFVAKRSQLLEWIRCKELRSADLLAHKEDQKITELLSKVIEEETRAQLAAEKRSRISAAEEWRKQMEMVHGIKRSKDAGKKRKALLRETSVRLAVNRVLNNCERMLSRQDVAVEKATRRAHFMARSEWVEARAKRLARAREERAERARTIAAITANMRELIKRT